MTKFGCMSKVQKWFSFIYVHMHQFVHSFALQSFLGDTSVLVTGNKEVADEERPKQTQPRKAVCHIPLGSEGNAELFKGSAASSCV